MDGLLGSSLDEKARLWATERAAVFAAEADTPAAQPELLALVVQDAQAAVRGADAEQAGTRSCLRSWQG